MRVLLQLGLCEHTGKYGAVPFGSAQFGFEAHWGLYQMLFHDVFEHYFEGEHKYFRGDYAFNIAGEIAAMGHCFYYSDNGFGRTSSSGGYLTDSSIIDTTVGDMKEMIETGYGQYGPFLISKIPNQRRVDHSGLELLIEEHIDRLQKISCSRNPEELAYDIDIMKTIRNSYTPQKIRNLYRWGYRQAEKIAPHGTQNVLIDFIQYWKDFCSSYDAEDICLRYDQLQFDIVTGKNLRWNAKFRSRYDNHWIRHDKITIY